MNGRDAAVVGGGPAGTAFAFAAASRGKDVIVFEKNAAPSPKVCGGGLSPRAWRALRALGLEKDVREIPAQTLRFIEVEHSEGERVRIPFPDGSFETRVVNRGELDAVLWRAAERAGAKMRDRSGVRRILRDAETPDIFQRWTLETHNFEITSRINSEIPLRVNGPHETHHARVLVGADGRNSFVAAQQDLSAKSNGHSHCFQFQLDHHDFSRVGVHFFIFPEGYCGLSVDGNGIAHLDVISLRGKEGEGVLRDRLFAQRSLFVEKLKNACFNGERPMARSPIGSGCRPFPVDSSLVLLGDAQAWVEPFTGEGIAMALESAWWAAQNFCAGEDFSRRIPWSSWTNGWVAWALKSSWRARAIIRLLDWVPPLARRMVRNVLKPD